MLKKKGSGADGKSVHIHKMNNNGTVGASIATYKWTGGWTKAEPFEIDTQNHIFLLKESNGIVHVHLIQD